MESVNVVTLAGNISSSARRLVGRNNAWTSFFLTTYRVIKSDGGKIRVPEVHEIRMFNSGSLFDYLKEGKFAVVVGRYCPESDDEPAYVSASSVTFPTRGDF